MPSKHLQRWEKDLNDAIAEVMATEFADRPGHKEMQEAFRGLIDIFGCKHEVHEHGRIRLVKRLNEEPINIAARKWLPADWRGNESLHVLGLMLWGITEANTVPGYWETSDVVGGVVAEMMRWNPAYVMALLQNPEHPELAHEEVSLTSDDLSEQECPEDAAWLLMELLEIAIMERNYLG